MDEVYVKQIICPITSNEIITNNLEPITHSKKFEKTNKNIAKYGQIITNENKKMKNFSLDFFEVVICPTSLCIYNYIVLCCLYLYMFQCLDRDYYEITFYVKKFNTRQTRNYIKY